MSDLSPEVAEIAAALADCEPDEVLAFVVPYQRQDDRQRALDRWDHVIAELRAAGWRLRLENQPRPDGEILVIQPLGGPTKGMP